MPTLQQTQQFLWSTTDLQTKLRNYDMCLEIIDHINFGVCVQNHVQSLRKLSISALT